MTTDPPGTIDPAELEVAVRVLEQARSLPQDHPAARTLKLAASSMYKGFKRDRKVAKRVAELAADRAVTEATATGSPLRIDDETAGDRVDGQCSRGVRR